MTFNINNVAFNFQYNSADIEQLSDKSLEDYSIVNRKHLEKIINNSERCLTEDEHRWLIKRECKRVISDLKKCTRGKKSTNYVREEMKEDNCVKMPLHAINRYVLNSNVFYYNTMPINNTSMLSIKNSENDAAVVASDQNNCIIKNNFTIINVRQLNININNSIIKNNNEQTIFNFEDIGVEEDKFNSEILIMDLEKIYWDKWRDYVKKKISDRASRCSKVDTFLLKIQDKLNLDSKKSSKIMKSSNNLAPKQIKTVCDRQQVKIENQKKMLEKQQKEIERLKLQQLKLESEKALLENQKMLVQTYDKSEKRLKINKYVPRNNCVVKASPSDILNRMEIRALDRQAKWEAIKERRRMMEQEELRKKQELKEKCLKEQMELKRKQLFEARENLRMKRIEEEKRKVEKEIWRENVKIADEFYRKLLLKRVLEAFKLNLMNLRTRIQEASHYYDTKIVETCFSKWRFFVNNNSNEKVLFAEQFYKRKLIKKAFLSFLKNLEERRKKEQVAEDWNNFKIQEFWFKQWLNHLRAKKIEMHQKMLEAESYHNKIIIKRCFNNWRKFPEIIYKERVKGCRLRLWHEKVQEILPDFIPPE
ncbi:Sfi1 spindle body [Cinara cedri]|uniref:Sfi1 spindle body n=1 Tax=Cinara cedri TaxID=506608 RepID=A0A5E4N2B3_9HEMI|nr:Sfi1 spindle body [Cinara cedri]